MSCGWSLSSRVHRLALTVFASAGMALALVPPAAAQDAAFARCAPKFHEELRTIGPELLKTISAKREAAISASATLPGRWMIQTDRTDRAGDAREAARYANTLMRAQGREAWAGSADARWVSERIQTDLSDYLGQELSPYLCGGVSHYLGMLRAHLKRLAPSGEDRERFIAAETAEAIAAWSAFETALKPAPLPRRAPRRFGPEMPVTHSIARLENLRPASLQMPGRQAEEATADSRRPEVFGPHFDPELPPLATKEVKVPSLATAAERIALLRDVAFRLSPAEAAKRALEPDASFEDRPVLGELASFAPWLEALQTPPTDPLARAGARRVAASIEILDYLATAESRSGLAQTYEVVFRQIEAARDRAMGEVAEPGVVELTRSGAEAMAAR